MIISYLIISAFIMILPTYHGTCSFLAEYFFMGASNVTPLLISFQVGQAESVLSSLQALKASKDTWQQHGSKKGGFETMGFDF